MTANAVPGFLPSTHGFHFANRFPSVPALTIDLGLVHLGIGNAAYGLCGGMCFAVRDRFARAEAIPPDTDPPAGGTALFRQLVRRQIDSFDGLVRVPFAFWRAAVASPRVRDARTLGREWPRIRAEIDGGHLAMVGLLRAASANPLLLGRNHQVLAYGYEVAERVVTLRIYDPNHPNRDDIELRVEMVRNERDAGVTQIRLSQSTGEALTGLISLPFVTR